MHPIQYPLVIAHRGFSAKYPENTLISFQAALDAGAQMIELDITLTRDRQIVVIHDDELDRTTNGRGMVRDLSLSELKALDAGSWFHPRFKGETVPTLTAVFNLVKHRSLINIEIKSSAYDPDQPHDAIERQLTETIYQENMQEWVLISSFKWKLLENIRQENDTLPLALLSKDPISTKAVETCKWLNAFAWNQNQRKCNPNHVTEAHDAGLRIFTYTVNSPERMKSLIKMGVDGIFSDDPTLHMVDSPEINPKSD